MGYRVGEKFGPWVETIRREHLVRYAGASGDFNPIHYDDEKAREFGLPGVIAHGMFNMGIVAREVVKLLPSSGRLEKLGVRFRAMVQPGQKLAMEIAVKDVESCEDAVNVERVIFDITLNVMDPPAKAITGQAVALVPRDL